MKVIYHRHPLHPFLNKIIFPFPLRLTTESRFTEVDRSMGGRIPLVGLKMYPYNVRKKIIVERTRRFERGLPPPQYNSNLDSIFFKTPSSLKKKRKKLGQTRKLWAEISKEGGRRRRRMRRVKIVRSISEFPCHRNNTRNVFLVERQ